MKQLLIIQLLMISLGLLTISHGRAQTQSQNQPQPHAQIQSWYVDDTLRVGVRPAPDRSLATLGVIVSGETVEVLERRHDFSRIRSSSDLEGWVKSAYLTQTPPTIVHLKESINHNKELQQIIDQLREEITHQTGTINNNAPHLEQLRQHNRDLQQQLRHANRDSHSWLYWFSGILAVGPLGFLLGLLWYRYQIMKKLGGLTL